MWRNIMLLFAVAGLMAQPAIVSAADKTPAKHVSKEASRVKATYSSKPQLAKATYNEGLEDDASNISILQLASSKAMIVNQLTGEKLYSKGEDELAPIASLTKLMTAMVVLDARLPMDEVIAITSEDVDTLKNTHSRLRLGTKLTRGELLQLAIMASENRAASALGRTYPGGLPAFLNAMHTKAAMLGMTNTHFKDATGLNSGNVSTASDLVKMVQAAYEYPEIRNLSTTPSHQVAVLGSNKTLNYVNTNALVRKGDWVIGLSKTGFINEAGRCLVMQAEIAGQPLIIVLLNSWGKYSRIGDANRIRKWIESSSPFRNMS
jgi:D-alanyl-D-alanine endopeptidase (penicillin-binding protein 7)